MDYEQFGRTLKAVRAGKGLSAREVSERTDDVVSRGMIANWESGRKASLDVAELLALAKALEVPPISLLYPLGDDPDAALTFSGYEDPDYSVLYRWANVRLLMSLDPSPPDIASQYREVQRSAKRAGWDL